MVTTTTTEQRHRAQVERMLTAYGGWDGLFDRLTCWLDDAVPRDDGPDVLFEAISVPLREMAEDIRGAARRYRARARARLSEYRCPACAHSYPTNAEMTACFNGH